MFQEDLSIYLMDQGVPCTVGAVNFLGLLAQPDTVVDLQRASAHSPQYELTYITKDVQIARDTPVTVNGVDYTAREAPRAMGDGAFSSVLLTKD